VYEKIGFGNENLFSSMGEAKASLPNHTSFGNEVSTSSSVFEDTKPRINSGFQMPNSTTRII